MLDRAGGRMSDLRKALPPVWTTPTMSPFCADTEKYGVIERVQAEMRDFAAGGGTLGGRGIEQIVTINGARMQLEGGGWALIRASSNTPNLVVVCESPESEAHMRAIFKDVAPISRASRKSGNTTRRFEGAASVRAAFPARRNLAYSARRRSESHP